MLWALGRLSRPGLCLCSRCLSQERRTTGQELSNGDSGGVLGRHPAGLVFPEKGENRWFSMGGFLGCDKVTSVRFQNLAQTLLLDQDPKASHKGL